MGIQAARRESDPAPAAFPSEARATLAAAIANSHTAQRTENEAREVFNRIRATGWAATRRQEEATKGVGEAREAFALRSAIGASVLGDQLVKDALAAEIEAFKSVDRLAAQREEAQLILKDAEFHSRKAAEQVPKAARAVVMEEIEHLLQEAVAAHEALVRCRLVLRNAVRHAHDPNRTDPRVKGAIEFLSQLEFPTMDNDWSGHPVSIQWSHFFEQLKGDAESQIPE